MGSLTKRVTWLRGRTATLAAALLVVTACQAEPGHLPDVVLITLDTTRADHLGAYGYERDVSPRIDRFARESVVYARAWSTSSWTYPAHASLLTGLHPTSHGAHLDGSGAPRESVTLLRADVPTLAELLRDAGYATGAFVGGPWLSAEFLLLRGYDIQDAEIEEPPAVPNRPLTPIGRSAEQLTDRALEWIETVPRDQPLHLFVNYFDPHAPYVVHPGFDLRRGPGSHGGDLQDAVDRYDGEIRYMDHHLGRLLDGLQDADRYRRSLTVITADHGDLFGENGVWRHGSSLYEGVLRVPLIVHLPEGREAGTVREEPVSIVDVLALVSTTVGIQLPDFQEALPGGRRPLVLAESRRNQLNELFYGKRFDGDLYAVVRWPWKLIHLEGGKSELYRIDADPAEAQERSRDQQALKSELMQELRRALGQFSPPPTKLRLEKIEPQTLEHLRALGYVRLGPEHDGPPLPAKE
jgi:arylsulfatase A-like enzyme